MMAGLVCVSALLGGQVYASNVENAQATSAMAVIENESEITWETCSLSTHRWGKDKTIEVELQSFEAPFAGIQYRFLYTITSKTGEKGETHIWPVNFVH